MYITYETRQYCGVYKPLRPYLTCTQYSHPPRKFSVLPKPLSGFMPTRLIRVSDMQIVSGTEVNEGYCALSYSWSWGGDKITDISTGKSKIDDQGKHKIIFPSKVVRQKPRGRKHIPGRTKLVKFKDMIQHICNDFHIKYIWYDQMCINQENKEEKQREIKQMHKIYSNAYCTLALAPEFRSKGGRLDLNLLFSADWFKRIWTLEESYLSKKLVLVGRNIHMWWYSLRQIPLLTSLFEKRVAPTVSDILYYAHIRSTTREHDRVFALANIFPDLMEILTINYDQPIEELMLQFYSLLAEKDLSILCFGNCISYKYRYGENENLCISNNDRPFRTPIQNHDLPSWTGIEGEHLTRYIEYNPTIPTPSTFQHQCQINGRLMEITSTCIISMDSIVDAVKPCVIQYNDIPDISDGSKQNSSDRWLELSISLGSSLSFTDKSHSNRKNVVFSSITYNDPRDEIEDALESNAVNFWVLSHFFPMKKESLFWLDDDADDTPSPQKYSTVDFFLTEYIDCSQYIILSGLPFDFGVAGHKRYPVIRKDGEYYKAIGSCEIYNIEHLFSDYDIVEKTFIIH